MVQGGAMPYNCIVLAKQVPDTKNITGQAMKEDGTVNRAALPAIFNPEDLNALELALDLRDRFGGRVTLITMGPPAACELLRDALYRGADEAILLSDRRFAAADTLATSYALACAIRKIGPFDLVIGGRQAIDGDTAQVGPGIAKRLKLLQLTYVARTASLDPAQGAIEVERRAEGGVQVLRTRLPCLITMLEATNEIRRGSMADALRAARETIIKWSAQDAGVADMTKCGLRGSPTIVKRVFAPAPRADKAAMVEPSGEPPAEALIAEIFTRQPKLEAELVALARGF